MAGSILGRKGRRVGIEKTVKRLKKIQLSARERWKAKGRHIFIAAYENICEIWVSDTRVMISMIRFTFTF